MASKGSFNWFRAETVISINHCAHLQDAIPSGHLCVILNGAQLNIEVREEFAKQVMASCSELCIFPCDSVRYVGVWINVRIFNTEHIRQFVSASLEYAVEYALGTLHVAV